MLKRLSLRARLLLGVVLLAALGLAAADAVMYTSLRAFLLHRVDTGLEAGHRAFEPPPTGESTDRGEHAPGGPLPQGVDWYQVRTLEGRVVRGGPLVEGTSPPKLPAKIDLPALGNPEHERTTYFTVSSRNGEESFRVRASIEPQNRKRILLVATSLGSVDGTLHRLLLIEVIATAAVLAALAALALWVVRLGLRPLREIEGTAAAITSGDLSRRVDHPDPRTEVGRVGSALNTMLDRIEASDRRLRRFVADASHELRTPLAAVRAYAELFERGAASRPEDLERSLTGIARESERMSGLVEDLLLLARLDEGRPLERDEVALDELVAEAVDAARVVDPERPLDVELEPTIVLGDRDRLRQVADNLLSNVRAHTPPATPARVSLQRDGAQAVLTVADSGPGMSEEEAARVFERFWRADESRSRARGGAGLGLSIVGAIAAAHGGRASARSAPGEGATFVVELPLDGAHRNSTGV
ncbi:MAG TPA: HAMP domain-containing sensor histidine kinase [Gaiellaceae bacterium]|nr:HAMP domain-containing sensor histidine kinase [Gaiellaceae bacterium]